MSKRIVLYYPQRVDPRSGGRASLQHLPLALLQIASWPERDGYEVVLIDGNLHSAEEAHRLAVEACEGALLFATTGIVGHQVPDGVDCTRRVRARHPRIATCNGGWFAGSAPELVLETGLFDAVALGQGEITFRELAQAVDCGAALESVPGLALWRDGALVQTPPRRVVGWNELPDCPWHLIDFEQYKRRQPGEYLARAADALPPPPSFPGGRGFVGISYFSSFGCPLDCAFCCSPAFTARRWKAMPAERMLDDIQALQERWGFHGLFFQDANWSVSEQRVRAFAEGLLAREIELHYYAFVQTEHVLRFAASTWDLLAESGLYSALIGAESGSEETLRDVHKPMQAGDNVRAAIELDRRGITPRATYVIGYPDEREDSMLATIDECRRMAAAVPHAGPTVWPYAPFPGAALHARALELGWRSPASLEEWGAFVHYGFEDPWPGRIPPRVRRMRRLYQHFATVADEGELGTGDWWQRHARRRLEDERAFGRGWPLGTLEAHAYEAWQSLARVLPVGRERRVRRERGWKTSRRAEADGAARRP